MNAVKDYLNSLEARERYLVIAAFVLIVVTIPYQFMWKPFSESLDNSRIRVQSQKSQYIKMQQQSQKIKQLRGSSSSALVSQPGKQFLNNLIQTAAKRNGLTNNLKIKSDTQNSIRVSLDNVPFDNVMNWLDQLVSNNGIIISKLNIDRQPSLGRVNVSVYLDSP